MDLEIGVNDNKFYKRTDGKGNIRFEYSEIKKRRTNQPENTVEVIEFKTLRSESSVAVEDVFNNVITITEDVFNNVITITEDLNPKIYYEPRERNIEIRNGVLFFRNPTGMNEQQEFDFVKKLK